MESSPPAPDPASDAPLLGVDRAAAFAAGPDRIPRKAIALAVACFVTLGLGGVLGDHFFGGPAGPSSTPTTVGAYPPPLPGATDAPSGPTGTLPATAPVADLPASLSALMGLSRARAAVAPGFSLTDQDGRIVSLAGLRGKVVVLSFFDASCDDICPVLATELVHAYDELGTVASRVVFVTVDTDPLALTATSAAPAETAAGISSLPDWYFLTGSLRQLDAVWKSYGVAVDVQTSSGLISHNDVLYLIDPSGRLRLRAVPFADESSAGTYSLPTTTEGAWAAGIADEARSLVREGT
jgi:cytochrome oxidase Cu insertion factor (SCO1/SenC/PrrC family)